VQALIFPYFINFYFEIEIYFSERKDKKGYWDMFYDRFLLKLKIPKPYM